VQIITFHVINPFKKKEVPHDSPANKLLQNSKSLSAGIPGIPGIPDSDCHSLSETAFNSKIITIIVDLLSTRLLIKVLQSALKYNHLLLSRIDKFAICSPDVSLRHKWQFLYLEIIYNKVYQVYTNIFLTF